MSELPTSSTKSSSRRGRTALFAMASLLIGVLAALALAEILARVAGFDRLELEIRVPGGASWGRFDYQTGWVNTAEVRGNNRQGYHFPRDYTKQKSRAARIALIGDSQVWGSGAPELDHAGVLLDRAVMDLETYSFGVPGFGPAQEFVLLRTLLPEYPMDAVFAVAFVENDLIDATQLMAYGGFQKPYFERGPGGWAVANIPVPRPVYSGDLEIGRFYQQEVERKFLRPNASLLRVSALYRAVVARSSFWPGIATMLSNLAIAELETVHATATTPWSVRRVDGRSVRCFMLESCPEEHWLDGLEAVIAAYRAMAELCRTHASYFAVVLAPSETELKQRRFPVSNALAAALEAEGIPTVDLRSEFAAVENSQDVMRGHWTSFGHRLVAKKIALHWLGVRAAI